MSFRYTKLVPSPKRVGFNRAGAPSAGVGMAVNEARGSTFWIPNLKAYRYINYNIEIAGLGLIQFGIYNSLFQRLIASAQIAVPAAGKRQIDLGAFNLPAGNYWIFVVCDTAGTSLWGSRDLSTTVNLRYGGFRAAASFPLPATLTITDTSGFAVPNLVLEAA